MPRAFTPRRGYLTRPRRHLGARAGTGLGGPAPRVGVVGCGATAQRNHLPALRRLGIEAQVVVDVDLPRARTAAAQFGVPHSTANLADVSGLIDCAIVATPPASHATVACALLEDGVHVLVEKPLGTSPEEGKRIVDVARAAGLVATVGVTRRYWHATRWLSAFLASGALAEVESFDLREGFGFGWPAETDYFIRRESGGGGTLLDIGSHVLDLVLQWFGGVSDFTYLDDNHGGLEADCELHLRMASGAAGFIELSRTRELRNSVRIHGTDWFIEVPDVYRNELRGHPRAVLRRTFAGVRGDRLPRQTLADLYALQLTDLFRAIRTGSASEASAASVIPSLELISACYSNRSALDLPWVRYDRERRGQ